MITGQTKNKVDILIKENYQLYNELTQSWCHSSLCNDFMQELILIIYEYDHNKMKHYVETNTFNNFVVAVIINQLKSNTSPFYKNYRQVKELAYNTVRHNGEYIIQFFDDSPEKILIEKKEAEKKQQEEEDYFNCVKNILERELAEDPKFIVSKTLLETYAEVGTMRKVSEKNKITLSSVHKYIQSARNVVKNEMKKKEKNKK